MTHFAQSWQTVCSQHIESLSMLAWAPRATTMTDRCRASSVPLSVGFIEAFYAHKPLQIFLGGLYALSPSSLHSQQFLPGAHQEGKVQILFLRVPHSLKYSGWVFVLPGDLRDPTACITSSESVQIPPVSWHSQLGGRSGYRHPESCIFFAAGRNHSHTDFWGRA